MYLYNEEIDRMFYFGFIYNQEVTLKPKRIIFEIVNSQVFYDAPKKVISLQQFILVNSTDPDYAMLFEIIIDKENKQAICKLIDTPKLGDLLLTSEEVNGVKINYF